MQAGTAELISFGPYRISPSQRLLTKNGETVRIGGRAFDLLAILVEHAGSVVSNRELLERGWPGIFVEDISLRVRIADLRKVLEHGDDQRYLVNVPGRGYCFVAEVSREETVTQPEAASPRYRLPPAPALVIGRQETMREICDALLRRRFLTIVGPGGIGKTTVALSVAWDLLEEFKGQVCFVELGPVGQPGLLAPAVGSALGLPIGADDPTAALVARLKRQRLLLVLDSAEHLVSAAAALAERLFGEAKGLHILVTTREALRIEGESALQLSALDSPPEDRDLTLAEVGSYPAAHLFLERCAAAGDAGRFTDADAGAIAEICRKLGGLALALELAAARVGTFGLAETAALLNTEFALRWPGRRTAPERHQTLNATLNWSYNLLSDLERVILRRLSVFAGKFTLASARHITAHADVKEQDVLDALNGLVAKSLVSVVASGGLPWFRLLDTTRSYAMTKLGESGEVDALRRRQATYYRDVFEEAAGDPKAVRDPVEIDDVRAALHWSFGKGGDRFLGAELAACSASVWLSNALLRECHAWMSKAAEVYAGDELATDRLLPILMARGSVELQMGVFTDQSAGTWTQILALAEARHDAPRQFFSHLSLWTRDIRRAWYAKALEAAERCLEATDVVSDPVFRPASEWIIGHTLHHIGRQHEAREHLQASLDCDTDAARLWFIRATGIDRRTDLLGIMANTLWLLGFADRSAKMGEQAVVEARALQFEISVGPAMIWAGLNRYLFDPDIGAVEQDMVELLEHGRSHAVDTEVAFALSILGLCQVKRGDYGSGDRSVREGLRLLAEAHLETFSPIVMAHLCEAAIGVHRLQEAADLMADLKIRDLNHEHFCSPEVLRVEALLAIAGGDVRSGENLFFEALTMARRQGALAWELRTATSAAEFLISKGRDGEALAALAPTYERFSEGFTTVDLLAARETLSKLGARQSH